MAEVVPGALAPETPVAAPEATPTPESTADQVQTEQPVEPKKTFDEEEVNRIVKKRLTQESRRLERVARAEAEAAYLRQQLESRQAPAQKPDGKPQEQDFAGRPYAEYVEALAEWKAEQKYRAITQEGEQQRSQREQVQRMETMRSKVLEGADEFEDFNDVALAPDVPISQAMAMAIAESDAPAKLAYYLGQHKDQAAAIFKLPPTQQVRALAKIEDQFKAAPSPTRTPAPIVPNSGNASSQKDPSKMTDKEFADWRRRQKAQRR